MKRSSHFRWAVGLVGMCLSLTASARVSLPLAAKAAWDLPDLDVRPTNSPARLSSSQSLAISDLQSRVPTIRVDFDERVGAPAWIASAHGFLSSANGRNGTTSPQALAAFAGDPDGPTKAFVQEHRALFGHGSEVFTNALVNRRFTTSHNGLRTVVWQQQVDGVPVFDATFISHTTSRGELVNLSSHFLPDPMTAAHATSPGGRLLTAAEALLAVANHLDEPLGSADINVSMPATGAADLHQRLRAPPFRGEIDAHLTWLPLDRHSLRLCWEVTAMSVFRGRMYRLLVDAHTGNVLIRHGLTENFSSASFLVFTNDSPTPFSPAYSSPNTNQPAQVARVLVVTNALDTNSSPNGWINDGTNTTTGNNVDAFIDGNGIGQPSQPRPTGSPPRVFAPALDLTQPPNTNADASVVNLFYWNNWMHDRLYEMGFTEAAGNFQTDNLGRGGAGGDAVIAGAQDGGAAGTDNNASFSTPPDGQPGVMEMYVWTGPTPNRDGALDTQIVLHEYTHGLSNRRVGGGVGITAAQSRGLGEGWSDFYSLALLSKATNNLNGNYPEASYASYGLQGSQLNYYFGIRRYPYSTDMTKDPVTFKDIDPFQADPHTGVPTNPNLTNTIASEIHNQGEIWCAALWDARANLINRYGFSGNQLMLQLVTDALNLTPANPTFTQARDALIEADLVDNGGANYHQLWLAFAKRGLGYGAIAPANNTTSGVTESFLMPDDVLVTPSSDLLTYGAVGGPFVPASQVYTVANTGTNTLNWSVSKNATWLTVSPMSGTLAPNTSTNVLVSINGLANSLVGGNYSDALTFSNLTSGFAQIRNVTLSAYLYFYSLNADPGWARQGQWAFGKPSGLGGVNNGFPDPQSGITGSNVFGVNLNGDYSTNMGGPFYLTAGPFNFSGKGDVSLQFQRWLNSDIQPFVSATIDVSSDGLNWSNVFSNGGTPITDSSWSSYQYDISEVADNQTNVYVRWGYQIGAGAFAYSGWNIDNIEFLGLTKLLMQVPTNTTKGAGLLANQGKVGILQALPSDLVVSLASSDTSRITVPASVTIHAGQTNATFDINVLDNHQLDGTQIVTISGTATGFATGSAPITIFDNESAVLTLSLPPSATEGDPPVQATLTSSAAPAADITAAITSSDTNSLQVPATVVLPANQTSVNFNVGIISNLLISPDRNITVTAHVRNWTDGVTSILIHYNTNTNFQLLLPTQARQSNGTMTNAGQVFIYGTLLTNLPVALGSSNTVELTVPPTVTIPAGQTSAFFNITVVDTGHSYGTLPVQIGAQPQGFAFSQGTINLTDDQTPPSPFNPHPLDTSTTNRANLQLTWSPGVGEGSEKAANGGFEMGSFTNWTISPNTNGGFIVDDGTFNPPSGDGPTSPFAGNFSALAYQQTIPGLATLRQDVALPSSPSIVLSWVDRIRNFGSSFSANEQFRVELRDTNDIVLAVLFTNAPTDLLLGDWTQRSVDLSAYHGRTVRIEFLAQAGLYPLDVHLDNVSIRASSLAPPTFDVYFGTNPTPGPGQLQGSTTNTFWNLPTVVPLTTYYWQIVAHRASQTPGPVWQFSSLSALTVSNLFLVADFTGNSNAVFQFQLDVPSPQTVSVDFATQDGSAGAPGDYTSTNGTMTFTASQTNHTLSIPVTFDTNGPISRTFFLNFSNSNNLLPLAIQASCTLVNATAAGPTLTPIPDQSVTEESTLTYTNSATNYYLPNEPLVYSLDPGAPAGAAINPTNGVFMWTPPAGQGGNSYNITVRVTDAATPPFLFDEDSFLVTVNKLPPVVTPIPNYTVHVGYTIHFTAQATDPDSNPLTFSLDPGAPAGASIDSNSGNFSWTTPANSVNTTNPITVRATDNTPPPISGAASFNVVVVPDPGLGASSFSGGHFVLSWSSISGQVYRVQFTTNLHFPTNTWINLPGDVTATGAVCTKLDPFPLHSRTFYRVLVLP